ncbi:hypothetical protein [Rhodoligotrophos defluvii]|uniref:hypothetical protein n=1 Tax=Rhodoligotrophos defluvii TaxID=2561934 RepID=UPI0010C9821A|nr:hypothetical protein [Rhodoligotrophos defluvii]
MESSRLFRLAARQGGGEEPHVPDPSGLGRARSGRRDRRLSVTVVETLDELNVVFALRTAGYLSDSAGREATEIDDSDFGAIHLLAWHGRAPVGALRIRISGKVATFDRAVVKRSKYRSIIARELADTATALCRAQGVVQMTGNATFADEFGAEAPESANGGLAGLTWDDEFLRPAAHRMGGLRTAGGGKVQGSKAAGGPRSRSDAQGRK